MSLDNSNAEAEISALEEKWLNDPRFQGIQRDYTARDVVKLRGTLKIEYTLATYGAQRLWNDLNTEDYVATFGALTGAQAAQMVKAGLKAIYVSGWQVAADANANNGLVCANIVTVLCEQRFLFRRSLFTATLVDVHYFTEPVGYVFCSSQLSVDPGSGEDGSHR